MSSAAFIHSFFRSFIHSFSGAAPSARGGVASAGGRGQRSRRDHRCGRGLGGAEGVASAGGRGLSNVGGVARVKPEAWSEPRGVVRAALGGAWSELKGVARAEAKTALGERRGRGLD